MSKAAPIILTTNEAAGVQDLEAAGVKMLTRKQVQTFLQISRPTLDRMIADRSICSIKVGRSRRIPLAAYKKYIAQAMGR